LSKIIIIDPSRITSNITNGFLIMPCYMQHVSGGFNKLPTIYGLRRLTLGMHYLTYCSDGFIHHTALSLELLVLRMVW
jgi:hypothetical protein